MTKTAKDAAGEAVSTNEQVTEQKQSQALVVSGDGDVSGPLALALSPALQDKLMLEFQEALHQVESGFGTLTAPGDIALMAVPFKIIDAITIDDFEDRKNGEIKTKHIFKLELADGRVLHTMQSDARPRRVLAQLFQRARQLQMPIVAGPYLYEKKKIEGQIQAAWIFQQQPGWRVTQQQPEAAFLN